MRRGGWSKTIALLCVLLVASCGGTGGGPSDSGKQFVFLARAQLFLLASVAVNNPTVLTLVATLLDPQGNPFRNTKITFEAEFADATFIPQDRNPATCNPVTCSNRGTVLTNDLGQAQVTLIAGLTTGLMRVIAEAPFDLNTATGISVLITNQGFVSRGVLGIIPAALTFVNPFVGPPATPGPSKTIFNAVGGTPPYRWSNSNESLGEIVPLGITSPPVNEKAEYTLTLTGALPTTQSGVLQDTVRLLDADATQATATVTVIFADCTLNLSSGAVTISNAVGGEAVTILITNGVQPFTITQTVPSAGTVSPVTVNTQGVASFTFTTATPPVPGVNTLLIRDARGCTGRVDITVSLRTLTVTPNPVTIASGGLVGLVRTFVVTGGRAPYTIVASGGGTLSTSSVAASGGSFTYTTTVTAGAFTILVTDSLGTQVTVPVTITNP
jgi:hypothetical protein